MLCGGSRRIRSKTRRSQDAETPGSRRYATISLEAVREATRPVFEAPKEETKGSAGGLHEVPINIKLSLPRSIRWYFGLSRIDASEFAMHKLLETRVNDRKKYWKTVETIGAGSEETKNKTSTTGTESKDTSSSSGGQNDAELKRMIEKDVARTYQDLQYFKSSLAKQILSRILLVWCKTCGALGYRQGMNELLAVCLLGVKLDADKITAISSSTADEETNELSDARIRADTRTFNQIPPGLCDSAPESIEADTFVLFRLLMQKMSPLYHSHPRDGTEASIAIEQPRSMGIGSGSLYTPLDRRVYRVHHHLLKRLDPHLYFRLENFGVLPQLYMLRWLRLLFAREAPLDQLLILLDAMLGEADGFELLDFMSLALVAGLRETLLEKCAEPSYVMSTLLQRNSIKNASALIKAAEILQNDKLLTSSTTVHMQVYNAPIQGNGARLVVKPKTRMVELKKAAMEGYVVGVKSQTLYWCVLEGPRLRWYAEPSRQTTVAQTWLDGCRVVPLGKGGIEIQAPPKPAFMPVVNALPARHTQLQEKRLDGTTEKDANQTGKDIESSDDQKRSKKDEAMSVGAGSNGPNTSNKVSGDKCSSMVGDTGKYPIQPEEASMQPSSTAQATLECDNEDGNTSLKKAENVEIVRVRLEVKDNVQYEQWLSALQEASLITLRSRSLWRQCF